MDQLQANDMGHTSRGLVHYCSHTTFRGRLHTLRRTALTYKLLDDVMKCALFGLGFRHQHIVILLVWILLARDLLIT